MNKVNNPDDKLVISKAKDTLYLADKRHCGCFYGFLNQHEVQLIKDNIHLSDDCMFWGGYDEAQRVFFGANVDSVDVFPFVCAKITYKKEYKLAHKDFLGAFMALGLERSTIGDILVSDGQALVFIKSDVFDYVVSETTKIGKVGVKISLCDTDQIAYEHDIEVLNFTVASKRLDVFVSAVCHLSREKSQRLIESDLVSVNYNVENSVSRLLKVADIITIRKYGKFEFAEESGFSKKGRTRILVNHFR